MDLTSVITGIATTNGMGLDVALIFLMVCCAILMGIQDWRITLISLFLGSIIEYIVFYLLGFSMIAITYILFISIILMAFSIFVTRNGGQLA